MDLSKDHAILHNHFKGMEGLHHNLSFWIAHEHAMFDTLSDNGAVDFTSEMESEVIMDFVKESEKLGLSVDWVNAHIAAYRSYCENNSSS